MMFERFTDRSRKVMQLALQEAQRFNHQYVDTGHVLLGLVKEGSGVAANVLKNLDIDLRKIRLEVEKNNPAPNPELSPVTGRLPHTPRTRIAITAAVEEAKDLGYNHVGTEHLLLGLLRDEKSVAARVLTGLRVTAANVREEVLAMLGHKMREPEPAPLTPTPEEVAALNDLIDRLRSATASGPVLDADPGLTKLLSKFKPCAVDPSVGHSCCNRLALAKRALVATGYFTEDQVDDDVAPRITELYAVARERKVSTNQSGERTIDLADKSVYPDGKVPEADVEICLMVLRTIRKVFNDHGEYVSAAQFNQVYRTIIRSCESHNRSLAATPNLSPETPTE